MTTNEVIDTIKAFDSKEREAANLVMALLCHKSGSMMSGLSCGVELARNYFEASEAEKLSATIERLRDNYEKLYRTREEIIELLK